MVNFIKLTILFLNILSFDHIFNMKTLIIIFYYVNISDMTRRYAENLFETLIKRTDLSKFNNNELEIIQQYMPITDGNTRTEVHHIPAKVYVTDIEEANKINKTVRLLREQLKNDKPIQNIMELYEW